MDVKKAVVCDDDRTTTMILKHLLSPLGFSVSIAYNGKEGLAFIESQSPDLVILDLEMPVKSGLSLLKDLSDRKLAKGYLIVLSSQEASTEHDKVRALGAREVMIKPFKPVDLIRRMKQLRQEGIF